MNKYSLMIILSLVLSFNNVLSASDVQQNVIEYSGQVLDAQTKEPLILFQKVCLR